MGKCQEALKAFRHARKRYQEENWTRVEAGKDYLRIVCQEKQHYLESDEDVTEYEIIHLHKFSPAIKAIPLVIDGKPILHNQTEKAHAHRTARQTAS